MKSEELLNRQSTLSLLLLGCVSCGSAQPDFGTLPRVVVELDDPPPPKEPPKKKAPPPVAKAVTSDLPDPRPLSTRHQFDFDVLFDKGELSIISHKSITLKLRAPTTRRVGRFAFELWSGSELIERVRFDFPLMGAGAPEDNDPFEKGLTTQTTLRVPFSNRANRARILDRKKRTSLEVPWPPKQEGNSSSKSDLAPTPTDK